MKNLRSPVPRFCFFLVVLGLGGVGVTLACTIPVFRFALDRWEADPYRLVVPSSWATQPEMLKLLVPLRGNGVANVSVVESNDPALNEAQLLFPFSDTPAWSGPLDENSMAGFLDSPCRQELVKRLLAGESVVWVICTSGGETAEAERIAKRLAFLQQVAALPPQDPSDPDSQLGPGPPLKLDFSVISLSLDDPVERHFATMLSGPFQTDFVSNGTSFAAPVFGKGRVLGAWPTADLDDTVIEDATLFLIGRCSCRVKNENPGWDVVLKVDWERALAKVGAELTMDAPDEPLPETISTTVEPIVVQAEPSLITAAQPAKASAAQGSGHLSVLSMATIAIAAICALAGLKLLLKP